MQRYAVPEAFVARHPGGVDAIRLGQGRNCTELFESYHSLSERPAQLLAAFFVEDAQPGDADFDAAFLWDGEGARFFAELRREARAFFAARGSHKASPRKWSVVLACAALCLATFLFGFLRGAVRIFSLSLPWLSHLNFSS